MYLSKLEIFGFKSFANRTAINFTKGITGIVGPNGCGKTNIVDGIRWCLGEQKSSTLRSDKMENVIFNGTRSKKPMGMSEVSLTLVNDSGKLPTEYSEVTITRRIFRSGESEYLLNKNVCRLKDITNLFMDTGMGTNAYSVIELKMIETILSNKADERRRMFEEAAGVNKYKLRRRLSLKKLDEVKSDLTRVNDIVSEVEKNVRSLERQAKKADRYNQLQTELREKELDLAYREFTLYTRNKKSKVEEKEQLKQRQEVTDNSIKEIENNLLSYRETISGIEGDLRNKGREINRQKDRIHQFQKDISVSEEKLKSLNQTIGRNKNEIAEKEQQIEEANESINRNQNIIGELTNQIENKEKEIAESDTTINAKKAELEEKRSVLKEKNDASLNMHTNINDKQNHLNNLTKNYEKNTNIIDNLNAKIQDITTKVAKTVGYIEELSNEKNDVKQKLEESEKHYLEKQEEKEALEHELAELKEKELELKSVLNTLNSKIEFLDNLITNLEDVPSSVKSLIKNNEWKESDKHTFADIGSAEDQYKLAIEASLKTILSNLLLENVSELKSAIDFLKRNELGKAPFYLPEKDEGKKTLLQKLSGYMLKRNAKKIEKESTFVAWASSIIKAERKWQPYFTKALSKTAIVNDVDTALKFNNIYPEFNFVTIEGDYIGANGVIIAGSSPKLDDTIFGRKKMLESLKEELPGHEKRLQSLQHKLRSIEEKIADIHLKAISEQGKILLNEFNNIEKQISQLEFENNKASEEIEKARKEMQQLAEEGNELDNEIASVKSEIEKLREEKETHDNESNEYEAQLNEYEESYGLLLAEYNQKKIELERVIGKLSTTKNSIESAESNKVAFANNITRLNEEIERSIESKDIIANTVEEKQTALQETYTEKSKLQDEFNEIEEKLNSVRNEASKLEKELRDLRSERQELSDKIHEFDMSINQVEFKLENLVTHIQEEYTTELEEKEFDDLDTYEYKERRSEVNELKTKLKNLGPINLLAYSEFEEESERLEFLHKQRNDLIESEKDLVKTINEINDTAQEQFRQTFEEIRNNFRKIFQTLFDPGDEADLVIDEEVDPLEAKIEIIAKPKGKRPTSIELLSGGEKTLTATALLFAIYLVKPSPFCILDEVDAPLDDANIDRFTKLLQEFSKETQFIIVTHNKRTMEAAENMYGVTMQEEGISKIASVQFNEELSVN